MSKASDQLEIDISNLIQKHKKLPSLIPSWMLQLGINPSARIILCERIGAKDRNNKTDILIKLEGCPNLKISAKLNNADYFGNWYGHKRFLVEFGSDKFHKLSKDATKWANEWIKTVPYPFVGVSICFGRRSGNTAKRFLDIFSAKDIFSIVAGAGNPASDAVANCLYIASQKPNSLSELIHSLKPITTQVIEKAAGDFMIAYRPINPLTEYSNRGKNVYTQFKPHKRLDQPSVISSSSALRQIGTFTTVDPTSLNHNHILKDLKGNYNIIVPVKTK